jgi:hypothetical protein
MISAVTSASQAQSSVANATQTKATASSTSSQKSTQASSAVVAADTVEISNAAQAALKEVLETPAQTAKEAAAGDRQAQRLLAKEAAEEKG